MPDAYPIHCHKCSAWIGEASGPMEVVGVFKVARDSDRIPAPRQTWRCKGCGWVNVFHASKTERHGSWRDVELKAPAGRT
jgi:hypothetical protein